MGWFESKKKKYPALWISSGWPGLAVESCAYRSFLKSYGQKLGIGPSVIFALSPSWGSPQMAASSNPLPALLRDFPNHEQLERIEMDARGDLKWTQALRAGLIAGPHACVKDERKGLDSSVWVPLWLLNPQASSPIIPFTMPDRKEIKESFRAGERSRELREKGALFACVSKGPREMPARGASAEQGLNRALKEEASALLDELEGKKVSAGLLQRIETLSEGPLAARMDAADWNNLAFFLGLLDANELIELEHRSQAKDSFECVCLRGGSYWNES